MQNISRGDLFVGREAELRTLRTLVLRGWESEGSMVFVEGQGGMGKTALLDELQEQCCRIPELKDATFIRGECNSESGPQDAYGPFADILNAYSKGRAHRESRVRKLLGVVAKETGPDWLQVIPVVGPYIEAHNRTTRGMDACVVRPEDLEQLTGWELKMSDFGVLCSPLERKIQLLGEEVNCGLIVFGSYPYP